MQQTEQKFTELFKKEPIKSIDFYNVEEKYLSFNEDKQWVIRGGIEFIFESQTISWGWSNEMHLYELIDSDLDPLIGELDVYELEIGELPIIEKLRGQKITNINFKWTFYQEMNEDMELSDEKTYIPQELKIKFEDGTSMQIATVVFQIKGAEIYAPSYDPQGALLISVNGELEISETEE
ncbi:MAG: hypothetical protein HC831_03415 [Chloroflexia bacterium]|nr:hypothetical protein [Chloroflexia bacterium]